MHRMNQYAGILLAAGRGRRFDETGNHNKLLQQTLAGDTVVVAAARTMCAVMPSVVAVIRPGAEAVGARLAELGCNVLVCPAADQGMGVSLAYAISHMQHAAGWIIGLADMPYVQTATYCKVIAALDEGADIAVPVFQNRRGNPAGFSRRHLTALLSMAGDQGARRLLQAFPVTEVAVDDPGIHLDIDTRDDLGRQLP